MDSIHFSPRNSTAFTEYCVEARLAAITASSFFECDATSLPHFFGKFLPFVFAESLKFLPLPNDGGHCAHWDNATDFFLYLFLYVSIRSVHWYDPVSVAGQFPGLVCVLTWRVNFNFAQSTESNAVGPLSCSDQGKTYHDKGCEYFCSCYIFGFWF